MEITCKYGIPYFSNYVNSDLSPEDAVIHVLPPADWIPRSCASAAAASLAPTP